MQRGKFQLPFRTGNEDKTIKGKEGGRKKNFISASNSEGPTHAKNQLLDSFIHSFIHSIPFNRSSKSQLHAPIDRHPKP